MRINSQDLISRSTQVSARNLNIVSATVIIVVWYDLNPNKWELLKGDVTAEVYNGAAFVIVSFLLVSLLVHWWADHKFYRKWFKSNEVSMGTLWGLSAPKSTETPIAGLQRRLKWIGDEKDRLEGAVDKMREIDSNQTRWKNAEFEHRKILAEISSSMKNVEETLKSFGDKLSGIEVLLDELQPRFEGVDFVARLVVYFWYFLFPISLSLIALTVLLREL